MQQAEILHQLKALNIDYEVISHPPLFHAGDADKYGVKLNCTSSKCLILTNKNQSHFYAVILPLTEKLNIKTLQFITNEKNLHLADATSILQILHVTIGSVSLLSLFSADKNNITIFVHSAILSADKVGFIPNDNTATVIFNAAHIKTILNAITINWQEL